jgi:phenylacetate-coenzyme A ligase PaaK-like adenylate-forming protein
MTIDTVTMPKPLFNSVTNQLVYRLIRESETASWRTSHRSNRQTQARLQQLLSHAASHSDFYHQRLAGFNIAEWDWQSFRHVPLLTRDELNNQRAAIDCAVTPQEHGQLDGRDHFGFYRFSGID